MEQDNNRRNGEWLKGYTREQDKDVRIWGRWKVDSSQYPQVKVTSMEEEIDSGVTDFLDYIVENSSYDLNYVLGVSVVEFYAILKRIDNRITKRAAQLKNIHNKNVKR